MEEGDETPIGAVDGNELHLDPVPDADAEVHTALPPRIESWRRRSVAGAILTGIGLGLKEVLEPHREEASIIVQSSGEPPSDLPVEADLGGIHPSANVVRIRPWLLDRATPEAVASSDPAVGPDGPRAPATTGTATVPGPGEQGAGPVVPDTPAPPSAVDEAP